MPKGDFVQQLRDLGYTVDELGGNRIAFRWPVPTGKFAGQTIRLGFDVPTDFPLTPPSGPHISPRLLPIQSGGTHPSGGIHESPAFGAEWQYWSRPMRHWPQTKRTAKDVLAHMRHLFDTL
jgi:hypothetical protein